MSDTDNDQNQNLIDDAEEATIGMNEIDNFDFERAGALMDVMAKCATIGVKATSVAGLAAAALEEMNEEAKAIARRRADAMQAEEAKRREALEAQRREREQAEKAEQNRQKAAADEAARNPSGPRTIPSGTQSEGVVPSKTNHAAADNARRL